MGKLIRISIVLFTGYLLFPGGILLADSILTEHPGALSRGLCGPRLGASGGKDQVTLIACPDIPAANRKTLEKFLGAQWRTDLSNKDDKFALLARMATRWERRFRTLNVQLKTHQDACVRGVAGVLRTQGTQGARSALDRCSQTRTYPESERRYFQGALSEIELNFKGAHNEYRKAISLNKNDYRPLAGRATVYWAEDTRPGALDMYKRAYKIARKLKDKTVLAGLQNDLGMVYLEIKQYKKAHKEFKVAYSVARKIAGQAGQAFQARSLNNQGEAHPGKKSARKTIERAIAFHKKALSLQTKLLDANDSQIAHSYYRLGINLRFLHKNKNALVFFQKALEIKNRRYAGAHQEIVDIYNRMGVAYENMDKLEEARKAYRSSLDIRLKLYGAAHPETALGYDNMGAIWDEIAKGQKLLGTDADAKANFHKAIAFYNKALSINLKAYGKHSPLLAGTYNNLASSYYELGDKKKTLLYLKKSHAIFKKKYGRNHAYTRAVQNNIDAVKNSGK